MPHRCVHCGKIYPDAAPELLSGCSCKSHFFFYFKEEDIDRVKKETEELIDLSENEKIEMEQDVRDIVGDVDQSKPVILDFESIRVKKPGKFEIDLVSLFKGNPLIYKLEDGKYIIDLASTFQLSKKEHENKRKGKKAKVKKA